MIPKRMTGRLADESKVFAHRRHQQGWTLTKIAAFLNVSQQSVGHKLQKYKDLIEVDPGFRKTEALYCEQDFLSKLQSFQRRNKKLIKTQTS